MTSDAWMKEQNIPFMLSDTWEDHIFHKTYCTSVLLKLGFQTLLGHKPFFREERGKKVTCIALFFSCVYKMFLSVELQLGTVTKIKDTILQEIKALNRMILKFNPCTVCNTQVYYHTQCTHLQSHTRISNG